MDTYPDIDWVRDVLADTYLGDDIEVLEAYVVGSVARGDATEGSDFDIAVVVEPVDDRSSIEFTEDFHRQAGRASATFPPYLYWEGRKVDFQFFYPGELPEDYDRVGLDAPSGDIPAECAEILEGAGHECYLVGGSVRDLFLGRESDDIDLATDAVPRDVIRIFRDEGYRVIPTGEMHGTVTVLFDDEPVEITTYRVEGEYSDSRRPDVVEFVGDLREDLARRDFTINAMAFDPLTEELVDYSGGLDDLERGVIRAVGDPVERFREDGLRPLRACRFVSQLGFDLHSDTFDAITRCLGSVEAVSRERVRDELMKLLSGDHALEALEYLRTSGLLQVLFPRLFAEVGLAQPVEHHRWDVWGHTIRVVDALPSDKPLLRLAGLLHDIGKPDTRRVKDDKIVFHGHEDVGAGIARDFMREYKFSNVEIDRVGLLVKNHMIMYDDEWTDRAVRRFVNRVGEENLEDLFLLREADGRAHGKRIDRSRMLDDLRVRIDELSVETGGKAGLGVGDLAVDGHDVMSVLGIDPGPAVGEALDWLHDQVLADPSLNDREALLSMLRSRFASPPDAGGVNGMGKGANALDLFFGGGD